VVVGVISEGIMLFTLRVGEVDGGDDDGCHAVMLKNSFSSVLVQMLSKAKVESVQYPGMAINYN